MTDLDSEGNNKLKNRPITFVRNKEPKEKQKSKTRISIICETMSTGPIYK